MKHFSGLRFLVLSLFLSSCLAQPETAFLPVEKGNYVCDPFSSGSGSDQNGLKAKLTYIPAGDPAVSDSSVLSTNSFMPGQAGVLVAPVDVYLSQLNVPVRSFSDGFVNGNGDKLKSPNNEDLIEWFSLRMESSLIAPQSADAGHYQLSLTSDDGAIVQVDPDMDGVYETLIDNDGTHPVRERCASRSIEVKAGEVIPMRVYYYQGPRYHIALELKWKKLSSTQSGLSCSGGYATVPSEAFLLQGGDKNPCAN